MPILSVTRSARLTAALACSILALAAQPAPKAPASKELTPEEARLVARNNAYSAQLETYLRGWLVDGYSARSAQAWKRDYSSPDAFIRSVQPNRERWRELLSPPTLTKTGPVERRPYELPEGIKGEWLVLPLGGLQAEGVLVLPEGASPDKPVPLVIAQHGIGSTPESPFGPSSANYHGYGRELVKAGFAVLAPLNLRVVENRNRIERLTRMAGTTLPGIEFSRLQHLLDVVLADPRIDRERVGMWGVSLGGMATMFFMPLEPRIKAGVVSAWFNHRVSKMVISDPRYSCFLDTREEHAFFDGWLVEFADHDAITLIAPRPVMIHHGKKDGISHWPDLVTEYETSRGHYEKLGLRDRIELDLHEGGHEARIESGLRFMRRWLSEPARGP